MPDHYDLRGNSGVARASHLQRAYRRRLAAFQSDPGGPRRRCVPSATPHLADVRSPSDVAVDFVEMTEIVARMQAAFLADLS